MKRKLVFVIYFLLFSFSIQAQKKLLKEKKVSKAKNYTSVEEALKRPKKVIKLNLDSTHSLQVLPIIHIFENLQELTLRGTNMQKLPLGIAQLANLQTLILGDTQLKSLSWELTRLTNLQELRIRHNTFDTLPNVILALENLRILDLGIDNMKYIPDFTNKLSRLEVLFLENNYIIEGGTDSLDWDQTLKSISNLASLKHLWLQNISKIKKLPLEFQQLTNLESLELLFLPNLEISQAFTILAHLPSLQSVDLSWNHLKTLPVEVEQLKQLKKLRLDGYSLEDLPLSLANVPNLEIELQNDKEIKDRMLRIREKIPSLKIYYTPTW